MKILFFVLLIYAYTCYPTNGTQNISHEKLDALFDHECRECAHNFNDGGLEQGRMVTVLPVIHPTYKLSLEFYVWGVSGASFDNLFHLTQNKTENKRDCETRQFGLWVSPIADNPNEFKTWIEVCVNSGRRYLRPNIGKDRWHSLEYGQYTARTGTSDLTHHHYIKLNGEIIHEEFNLEPQTFQDVKVYKSSPFYPAAYGVIRKFKYRKYDDFCLNYCP